MGIRGLAIHGAAGNPQCLTCRTPDGREFHDAAEDAGWDLDGPLGCVWTSLYVGDRWGLLEMTAATSSMSRLFEHSATLRGLVRDAFAGLAPLVALDQEEACWTPLDGGPSFVVSPPDAGTFDEPRDARAFDVDAHAEAALAEAALTARGP